jgi:hypothetical protein
MREVIMKFKTYCRLRRVCKIIEKTAERVQKSEVVRAAIVSILTAFLCLVLMSKILAGV